MTDKESLKWIENIEKRYPCSLETTFSQECELIALNMSREAILQLSKIKEITARALRSSDPINLYKSCCINEIAELLGVKVEDPAEKSDSNKDQITIDDII